MTEHHIFTDVDQEKSCCLPFASGQAAVFSARRPGAEKPNQDAAALIVVGPSAGVAVVADGAGGHPSGADAAALAVYAVRDAINGAEDLSQGLRDAIINGFEQANEKILALGVGAAATIAAVELDHGVMRSYHVGDSMVLVTGQRGLVKWLTVPHSPVGYAVESGLLDPSDALHHEDLHLISNSLGRQDMRIELGASLKLAPRDTVVLASDGLSDNLHLDEIVEGVRKGPLQQAADRLAGLGRARMQSPQEGSPSKPDDLTFIALRVGASSSRLD